VGTGGFGSYSHALPKGTAQPPSTRGLPSCRARAARALAHAHTQLVLILVYVVVVLQPRPPHDRLSHLSSRPPRNVRRPQRHKLIRQPLLRFVSITAPSCAVDPRAGVLSDADSLRLLSGQAARACGGRSHVVDLQAVHFVHARQACRPCSGPQTRSPRWYSRRHSQPLVGLLS
jgi:hypothetical protein